MWNKLINVQIREVLERPNKAISFLVLEEDPRKPKRESNVLAEDAIGMFLRFMKGAATQHLSSQHDHATSKHFPTTESVRSFLIRQVRTDAVLNTFVFDEGAAVIKAAEHAAPS